MIMNCYGHGPETGLSMVPISETPTMMMAKKMLEKMSCDVFVCACIYCICLRCIKRGILGSSRGLSEVKTNLKGYIDGVGHYD